jgi:tetratricopeptide (TPR) repeat protein
MLSGILTIALMACTGCDSGLPKSDSPQYRELVAAFYTGLAALQVGDDVRAENELARSTQIAAGEPAGWANWGILRLRQRDFEAAGERIGKAQKLAPQNDQIFYLMGLVESGKGKANEAVADFHKAVELNPRNLAMPNSRGSYSG